MSRKVPQTNYPAINGAGFDRAWTPWHAAVPLFSYLPADTRIWECCAGDGWLARWLTEAGYSVRSTDYKTGHDALTWAPDSGDYDVIVTNPPWSLKYKFIERLFALGKPWALLVPIGTTSAATARKARNKAGKTWEELRLDRRVDYHMPTSGFHNNGAQVTSLWLCHGLLPEPIVEATMPPARPEHKPIKPPKKRPINRGDVLAWLSERVPGNAPLQRDDVARLILEARNDKNAIVPIEQTSFLEAA